MLGRIWQWVRLPGLVRPMSYEGDGMSLQIKTSPQYTVLTVNGTDFFFRRANGKLDGTGAMFADLPRVALRLLDSPEGRTQQ